MIGSHAGQLYYGRLVFHETISFERRGITGGHEAVFRADSPKELVEILTQTRDTLNAMISEAKDL